MENLPSPPSSFLHTRHATCLARTVAVAAAAGGDVPLLRVCVCAGAAIRRCARCHSRIGHAPVVWHARTVVLLGLCLVESYR